jgi:hypothetical protein
MSILDDAIREHLELKRAHGADEGELQKLEDEAFGPPQRPDEVDPFNEAPTQFLLSPDAPAADAPEIGDEDARSGRRPNITDLQEAPPAEPVTGEGEATGESDDFGALASDAQPPDAAAPAADVAPTDLDSGSALFNADEELLPAPDAPPPSPADAADVPLPPPPDEAPAAAVPAPTDEAPAAPEEVVPTPTDAAPTDEAPAPPAADESVAEHQIVTEHEIVPDAAPDTDERHHIADQPTQMFDVQNHIDAEVEVPAEQASPSDDELVDAAQSEPQAAPPAPEDAGPPTELYEQQPLDTRGPDAEVAGHPPTEEESAEFDFFNEQRLSEELDQALEAPLPPTDEHVAMPQYDDAPAGQAGIFDFESAGQSYEEDPSEEVLRRHDTPAPEPPSEEYEQPSEEYEPPSEETPRAAAEPDSEESPVDYDPDTGHEDVLEDTPRFLEDAPEDDDLWFEQKPPKDFDLD